MKKYILPALLLFMAGVSSCIEDESSYADNKLNDIQIEDNFQETYRVESFAGQFLDIPLTIGGGYQGDELTFEWKLFDPVKDGLEEGYEAELISTDKDLHYEVNLKPGTYTVTCQATSKEYGYASSFETTLITSTPFSQGFYILKETAESNTELDFFNVEKGNLRNNLLQDTGNEMKGKPKALSMSYESCYVNEDDEQDGANVIHVSTETGEYKGMRSTDMRCIFTRENLCYDVMAEDEHVIGMYRGSLNNWLITNQGFRATYTNDIMPSKGYYGTVSGEGASTFFTSDAGGNRHYLWDETNHHLISLDFSGGISELEPAQDNLTDYECVSAGPNAAAGVITYLFVDKAKGRKVLYQLSDIDVKEKFEVDVESHLHKGNAYTTSANQAAIVYVLDNNKLYAHSLQDHSEMEYKLKGLPAGTVITYISNQYFSIGEEAEDFDYLVVGSQNGDQYKFYMYETLGGQPNGEPVKVIEGEGKFKCIRYLGRRCKPVHYPYTD